MKKVYKGLKIKVDNSKLIIDSKHEFKVPDTDIVIVCKSILGGENLDYAYMKADAGFNFDYRKIFEKKVIEIKNLSIEFEGESGIETYEIKKAEDLLKLPSDPDVEKIIQATSLHLITGSKLTEDEEKNSDSGISA